MVNKSGHEFVPEHEIVSEKETKEILAKMDLKRENLPKILSEDPQARKLSAKPGQVLRISRSDYGNDFTSYRLVVEG